jgi:hypothetical protein
MNFLELQRKIINNLGIKETNAYVYTGEWINNTLKYINDLRDWWFLRKTYDFTTTEGVQEYPLPVDYKNDFILIKLDDGGYRIIDYISLLDALKYYGTDKGEVAKYYIENSTKKLLLFPTPNKSYNMKFYYHANLIPLVNADDTNILLEEYPYLIEAGAMKLGLEFLRRYEEAQYYNARFQEYIKELSVIDNEKKLPEEFVFIPRRDYYASNLEENTVKALLDYW